MQELAIEAALHLAVVVFIVLLCAGVSHRVGGTCNDHSSGAYAAVPRK